MENEATEEWGLAEILSDTNKKFSSHNHFPVFAELHEAMEIQDSALAKEKMQLFSQEVKKVVSDFLCELHTSAFHEDISQATIAQISASMSKLEHLTADALTASESGQDLFHHLELLSQSIKDLEASIEAYQKEYPPEKQQEHSQHTFLNSLIRSSIAFQKGSLSNEILLWKLSVGLDQIQHFPNMTMPPESAIYSEKHRTIYQEIIKNSEQIYRSIESMISTLESHQALEESGTFTLLYQTHLSTLQSNCKAVDQLFDQSKEIEASFSHKICPSCGIEVTINDRVCSSCNKPLPQWNSEQHAQELTASSSTNTQLLHSIFSALDEVVKPEETFPQAIQKINTLAAWMEGQKILLSHQQEVPQEIRDAILNIFEQYTADLYTVKEMAENHDVVHLPNLKERIYLYDQDLRQITSELEQHLS